MYIPFFSKVFRYYRNWRTTAADPRHSDTYLVEYPKSGVTWLSTLLANAALIQSERKEVANFVTSRLYVPDIHLSRNIGPAVHVSPPVRFIKSHAERNDNYIFVIYLVRKPISVLRSYYRFLNDHRVNPYADFDAFCRSEKYGVSAWKKHVRSWLEGADRGRVIHVVRYEDLVFDAYNELSVLNGNFGWGLDDKVMAAAVSRSAANEMMKSESLYASRNPIHAGIFVKGQDSFMVKSETIDYVNSECQYELKISGYSTDVF